MPASALALALAAALVHALWNTSIAGERDSQVASAVALGVGVVALAPFAALAWRVEPAAVPFVAASSALHLGYFCLLAAAYQRGELTVVYPVARGSGPVLTLPLSVVALGAGVSAGEVAGVLAVGTGVLLIRGRGEVPARDIVLALGVGACIAGYTVVDKEGVRHADPLAYLGLLLIFPAVAYLAIMRRLRGRALLRAELGVRTALAGLGMVGAYALALAALRLASAASVAAVRETSVLIAALLGALVLHEPLRGGRVAGAVLIAAGIAAVALA